MKNALKKARSNPKDALQEFLMQYRRTPLSSGYSPSELLQGRQIRARIDVLIPTPTRDLQAQVNRQADKAQRVVSEKINYSAGTPCYALYFGPRRDKDPRWVPAVVTKRSGARTVNVRVFPTGRRHIEQLLPRHTSEEDYEVTTTSAAGTDDSQESSDSIPQGMGVNTNDQVATTRLPLSRIHRLELPLEHLNLEGHNGNSAVGLVTFSFLSFLRFRYSLKLGREVLWHRTIVT